MSLLLPALLLSAALSPQQDAAEYSLADVMDRIQNLSFLAEAPGEGEASLRFSAAGSAGPELSETEIELFQTEGPGVLGRLTMVNPAGELNFYFDGAEEPGISMPARQFFSLRGPFVSPLVLINGPRGVLRAPIPFSSSLRVTTTQASPRFEAGVHKLADEVSLASGSTQDLEEQSPTIDRLARAIASAVPSERWRTTFGTGACDRAFPFEYTINGNGIVQWFTIEFIGADRISEAELADYLRSMKIEFYERARSKGNETLLASVPFGDFFGTAPDAANWRADVFAVDSSAQRFTCRLPIPYVDGFAMRLKSVRKMEKRVMLKLTIAFEQMLEPPAWRLRAGFFQHRGLEASRTAPIDLAKITGPGRLVGLALTGLYDGQGAWDEGALTVTADGAAQTAGGFSMLETMDRTTRRDGPASFGYTSRNRFWVHDSILFDDELQLSLALGEQENAKLSLEGMVYWYAPAESVSPLPLPEDETQLRPLPLPERDFELEAGTVEAEDMRLDRRVGGGEIAIVDKEAFPGVQLKAWQWKGFGAGEFVRLGVDVRGGTEWTLAGRFWCYPGGPTLQASLSGRALGTGEISLDAEEEGWKLMEFGPMNLVPREHILLLGTKEVGEGEGPGIVFDYLLLRPKK